MDRNTTHAAIVSCLPDLRSMRGRVAGPLPQLQRYPFPPYLSHQAIHDANSGHSPPLAARSTTAAEASTAEASAHTVWRHTLMFDSRSGAGGAGSGSSSAAGGERQPPPAATWTCRLLRALYKCGPSVAVGA